MLQQRSASGECNSVDQLHFFCAWPLFYRGFPFECSLPVFRLFVIYELDRPPVKGIGVGVRSFDVTGNTSDQVTGNTGKEGIVGALKNV